MNEKRGRLPPCSSSSSLKAELQLERRALEALFALLDHLAAGSRDRRMLLLLDISMPKVDGLEALKRIKADPVTRHIPIVAVTSYALVGDEAKTREAGCDGYVAKPFSPRQLLEKVRAFIG